MHTHVARCPSLLVCSYRLRLVGESLWAATRRRIRSCRAIHSSAYVLEEVLSDLSGASPRNLAAHEALDRITTLAGMNTTGAAAALSRFSELGFVLVLQVCRDEHDPIMLGVFYILQRHTPWGGVLQNILSCRHFTTSHTFTRVRIFVL